MEKLDIEGGGVVMARADLCLEVKSYFNNLFVERQSVYDLVLEVIQRKVSDDDNSILIGPLLCDQFTRFLSQMYSDKAPDPDRLNSSFYKRFWDLYEEDIFIAASTWLATNTFPSNHNDTNLVLIPKGNNPTAMTGRRPISLCNVL